MSSQRGNPQKTEATLIVVCSTYGVKCRQRQRGRNFMPSKSSSCYDGRCCRCHGPHSHGTRQARMPVMKIHEYAKPIKDTIPMSRLMNTGCVFESLTMPLAIIRITDTKAVATRSNQVINNKFDWTLALTVGLNSCLRNKSSMRVIFVAMPDAISELIAATKNAGVPSNSASKLYPLHLSL